MKSIMVLSILLVLMISCGKDDPAQLDCESFTKALLNIDSELVNNEINKLTVDLIPLARSDDDTGHRENLNLLIDRINSNCEVVTATLGCYACIYTLPPVSEIKVELDSLGSETGRIISLATSAEKALMSLGVRR